jgi:hypothetical protein
MIRERVGNAVNLSDSATACRARTPTPTREAKPAGVRGAQLWVKIGDPAPVDPSS